MQTYTVVTNEVLAPYGKTLTWELKASLMGRPAHDAATRYVTSVQPSLIAWREACVCIGDD